MVYYYGIIIVSYRLEKWKSEYRKIFPVWIEMLGTD